MGGLIAFLSPGYPYITNLLDPIQEILYYFRSNSYFYFMERDGYRNKTENNVRMIIIFILNYKNISFLTYFSLLFATCENVIVDFHQLKFTAE